MNKILATPGVDITIKANNDRALHSGCENGSLDSVKLLIEHYKQSKEFSANWSTACYTAMNLAQNHGHGQIVSLVNTYLTNEKHVVDQFVTTCGKDDMLTVKKIMMEDSEQKGF